MLCLLYVRQSTNQWLNFVQWVSLKNAKRCACHVRARYSFIWTARSRARSHKDRPKKNVNMRLVKTWITLQIVHNNWCIDIWKNCILEWVAIVYARQTIRGIHTETYYNCDPHCVSTLCSSELSDGLNCFVCNGIVIQFTHQNFWPL